jgi:AcrR family transcriptional regulator
MSIPPRPSRRERQAQATRQDITAAARRLFVERGYAATSVAQIAEEAGVAVQTIYDSLGSKRAIALTLVDLIDEAGGVQEMVPVIMAETDPRQLVGHQVHLTRLLNERFNDLLRILRSTAPLEPDVAVVLAEGYRRHRSGAEQVVSRLDAMSALRPGLAPDIAAAFMAELTSEETYQALTQVYGWSWEECEQRTTAALQRLLLAGPTTDSA